jgi:hypothetical protein
MNATEFHANRKFAETSFGKIAYVERGVGPAALFIHGFPLNGFQWRDIADDMQNDRRCLIARPHGARAYRAGCECGSFLRGTSADARRVSRRGPRGHRRSHRQRHRRGHQSDVRHHVSESSADLDADQLRGPQPVAESDAGAGPRRFRKRSSARRFDDYSRRHQPRSAAIRLGV